MLEFRNILKYFAHGFVFSILFIILGFVWAFLFVTLVVVGLIIGLIIGIGLLIFIVGFINALIASFLWFPVKMSFWSLLGHGLLLFVVLLPIDIIIVAIPNYAFPGITTEVVTRIILAFLYGFIGKKIAGFWEEVPEGVPESVEEEWRDRNL